VSAHDELAEALASFDLPGRVVRVEPHRGGHIHRSWVVSTGTRRFLLQALNIAVFPDPAVLMDNAVRVTDHLRTIGEPTLTVVAAVDGRPWWTDRTAQPWRMFVFIEGSVSYPHVTSPRDSEEVGLAFGRFASAVVSLPGRPLAVTLPGFHDVRRRWQQLWAASDRDVVGRVRGAGPELERVTAAESVVDRWEAAVAAAPSRVAHNDAKVDNVLFDAITHRARCVVDLDTVMTGTVLADLGDLVRSAACPVAEDEVDLDRVRLDDHLLTGVIRGFATGAGQAGVTHHELTQVVSAAQAITFEQAMRFLADHLDGDHYYPTSRPGHNLDRARAQLRMLAQLIEREADLAALVERASVARQ
jgi:N-acetylhexosamine 1-kinase